MSARFRVVACAFDRYDFDDGHPEHFVAWGVAGSAVLSVDTDDPAEAKAAYARACEFVRTGELP